MLHSDTPQQDNHGDNNINLRQEQKEILQNNPRFRTSVPYLTILKQ